MHLYICTHTYTHEYQLSTDPVTPCPKHSVEAMQAWIESDIIPLILELWFCKKNC